MGLNFLGLGFAFGAKDMGMSKVQAKIAGGFTTIVEQMGHVHEGAKPAFASITEGLDTTSAALDAQQPAIAKWAQEWADNITGIQDPITSLKESALKPLFDTFEEGSKSATMAWNATFGDSFRRVGEHVDKFKGSLGGVLEAVKPLTNVIKEPFLRGMEAVKGMGNPLDGLGGKALAMGAKWKVGVTETIAKAGEFFKSRAEGIKKSATVVFEGFDSIKEGVQTMNKLLRVNKLKGFLEAISVGTLSKISGALGKIGSEGMNLTTGLEATMVGLSKSAKHSAANLGLTGAELKKVSSQAAGMAHGLNIGADSATQAIVGMKTATKELGAVGIKSASDLALLNETFGVNSQQFSKQLKMLKKLGLSNDDIQGVTSSFFMMGKATQDVGGALNSLPEMMEKIQAKAALMGKHMDPKQLAEFAKQTAGLGAALGTFGVDADKARSISMGLAGSQVDAAKAFQGLFQGIGNEIPDMMKELNVMGFSQEKAFEMMQQGPAGMVEAFHTMVQAGKRGGADMDKLQAFMGARMEKAGIANADVLVNFLAKGDDAAFAMMKTAQKTTINLGKMAKAGHSTGRTLAESFELAKDSAIAHFRAGGKASGNFLRDFTKSASAFNKILDETSKKGGPLGNFVDKLREVHKLGAAGLLPKEMQGAGILLGEIVNQLGPLLGVIGGAILFFPGLTAVLGPVVAIMGLFAINLFKAKLAGESWSKAFKTAFAETVATLKKGVKFAEKAFDQIVDGVLKMTDSLQKKAAEFDWAGFFTRLFAKIGKGLKAVAGMIGDVAKTIMGALFGGLEEGAAKGRGGKIASNLTSIFKSIFGGLVSAVKDIDWAGILKALGTGLTNLLAKSNELLKKIDFGAIAGSILDLLGMGLKALGGDKVGKFLSTIAGFLIERIGIIATAFLDVVSAALEWLSKQDLSGMLSGLVGNILNILMSAIDAFIPILGELIPKIIPLLKKAFEVVITFVKTLPAKLGDILSDLGPKIGPALKKLVPILIEGLWSTFKFMQIELPLMIIKALPAIVKGIAAFLKGALKFIHAAAIGIFEGIRDWLVSKFPALAAFLDPVIDAIKAASKFIQKWFGKILDWIVDAFKWVGDQIAAVWHWLFGNSYFVELLEGAISFIIKLFEGWQKLIGKVIKWLGKAMAKVVKTILKVWKSFKRWFDRLWTNFKTLFKKVLGYLIERFNRIKEVAFKAFNAIWKKVKEVFGQIKTKISGVWTAIKKVWEGAKTWFSGIFDTVYDAVAGPGSPWQKIKDYIVGIWSGKGGIKEKWAAAKTFFTTMFESIGKLLSRVMKKIKDKIGDALGPLISLFDTIADVVDELWGHSMDKDATKSLRATVKIHDSQVPLIVTAMDTIGKAVKRNFTKAYAGAVAATRKFQQTVVPLIEQIAQKIADAFKSGLDEVGKMIDTITGSFEGMMKKLNQQVLGAQMALKSLETAQRAVTKAAKEAREEEKKVKSGRSSGSKSISDLAMHINDPDWWRAPGDGMRSLLRRQHAEQIAQMAKMATHIGMTLAEAVKSSGGGGKDTGSRSSTAASRAKGPAGGARGRRVTPKPPSKR